MGAKHITFGDPDFFNGPGHAMRIVQSVAEMYSGVTYDITVKVEHIRKHKDLIPRLAETGCLFVTTAVESFDDNVLEHLSKGHSRADIIQAVNICRAVGQARMRRLVRFGEAEIHGVGSLSLKDLPGTGGYTKTIDGKEVVFPARLARKGVVLELDPRFDAFIQLAFMTGHTEPLPNDRSN